MKDIYSDVIHTDKKFGSSHKWYAHFSSMYGEFTLGTAKGINQHLFVWAALFIFKLETQRMVSTWNSEQVLLPLSLECWIHILFFKCPGITVTELNTFSTLVECSMIDALKYFYNNSKGESNLLVFKVLNNVFL